MSQREVVLDTETTGLDPINGSHRITEIGCVELMNHIPTGKFFHSYINPEREVDTAAIAITGLTYDFLKDKPLFKDIASDFLTFIGLDILVIHNAPFDLKFLNFELRYAELPLLKNNVIDTLPMARGLFPGAPANIDALSKRFDIDLSCREKHGALIDAELLAKIYLMLLGGPQKQLFKNDTESTNHSNLVSPKKNQIPSRNFPQYTEELNAHKEFIETIPHAIWED